MKSFRHLYRATSIGVAGIAGLALAGGCCTKSYKSASYQTSQPTYAETPAPAPEPAPTPTGRMETNMVVPLFQESLAVGKREVDTGDTVKLRKVIKTETVSQPIELRREELVIDRDSSAGASGNQVLTQPFQEGETVIRLKREEAVVEKQTTSAGAIVLQTRSTSTQTNIQAQVRREDIDIDKGNSQNVIIGQNVHSSASASGASESAGGQAKGAGAGGTITDPAPLTASGDVSQWIGQPVLLSGMKVHKVTGNLVVIEAGNKRLISVVCSEQPSCKSGDTVSIAGKIQASADAGLSGEAAKEISARPCYIDATKVEISNQ
jgi:uncharacterized protein (TIGR02271 family)